MKKKQGREKRKVWLRSLRFRTLPLSISGILVGSGLAFKAGAIDWTIFTFAILTTVLFQLLSNLANDYGDGIKATDNAERVGPMRAVQSGVISPKEMKFAVGFVTILALVSAMTLIYYASKNMSTSLLIIYALLAILCILAAITYTVGKKSYGYYGLGDVMVFIFFGLVSVLGVYSLYTKTFEWQNVLPATTIGLLSVAVLNLNNMRDYYSDKKAKKNTLVVYMGLNTAKIYHTLLILTACCLFVLFILNHHPPIYLCSLLPSSIIFYFHLMTVAQAKTNKELDPQLKIVALSTFILAALYFTFVFV